MARRKAVPELKGESNSAQPAREFATAILLSPVVEMLWCVAESAKLEQAIKANLEGLGYA